MITDIQSKKPVLAILIYSLGGGGAERVLSTLLPYFHQEFEVHLVLLEDKNSYELQEPYTLLGKSQSSDCSLMKLLRIPMIALQYRQFLQRIQADLSFSLLNRPNYMNLLATAPLSIQTIISEHATPSMQYQGTGIGARISRFLIRRLYPKANHIVSVSLGVKKDLEQNFFIPHSRIQAIYNPFEIQQIEAMSQEESALLSRIQDRFSDRKMFIAIGRLDSGKNHHFLIESFKILKDSLSGIEMPLLLILGEGELEGKLKQLIIELGLQNDVFLGGFIKNPYPLIKNAVALLSASLYEGFLNVLVESLALGIPPISSDCPNGPREILQSQKPPYLECEYEITKYGVLFSLQPTLLAEILLKVIQKDICFDSAKLKEYAKKFDAKQIADAYIQAFKNCLESHS
ncbi:hypothetical protein CCZ01_00155 [Helicobacter monodelphidis]|uniref:glycosyltransferase n=1 Tax=Helicobacter sp. 15-1451 TaxID=2004995 RepID=UPI000DCDA93E|nr:glycosyltransferase [Helicobacter sp. 15-1451]RAX59196.1 hypothetical protein CCZ01_00155 [Helicobacter sp. 15-1451]